ncbi:sulfotransferase family protein [Flavisphingomonas formosensis]|uniref:sulfotransferase family protein n=1 Tax=Flavisphingomonas formosensis TaxID=861534 RepID=UPI0012FBEC08|nr:sulfotransferase [Sphingomonas formosensis]
MTDHPIPAPAELMAEASNLTGLSDFGPSDWFLTPLGIEVDSINAEARLNESGAVVQRSRLVGALANRLRLFEAIRRHPEIATQPIKVAGVLLGLSRSGTTMMHRLLNSVPSITAMKWWETHHPATLEDEVQGQPTGRRAQAQALFDHMLATIPDLMSIHPMSVDYVDEEITVLDQSFMSTTPESFLWIPTYAKWLETADHQPAYDELVLWLRYLQWQDPAREGAVWMLKTPNHIAATAAALKAFPDATFIMTHRDPVRAIPSYCSMVSSLYRMSSDHVDLQAIGRHWQHRWSSALRQLFALRDADPAVDARFLDLRYDDIVKAPMEQIAKVYARIGKTMTAEDEATMVAWMNGNARDNRPAHEYALEQFGLTEDGLKETFGFYRKRMWPEK